MYRKRELNPDRMPLEADHPAGREGGQLATRLLLATCNRSRGGVVGRARQLAFTPVLSSREW